MPECIVADIDLSPPEVVHLRQVVTPGSESCPHTMGGLPAARRKTSSNFRSA